MIILQIKKNKKYFKTFNSVFEEKIDKKGEINKEQNTNNK